MAEDDEGHATLVKRNLARSGITNELIHFKDGQELLNFFFKKDQTPNWQEKQAYLLLLDIRMPKVDGVEVLRQLKEHAVLKKMPVTMLTTTDDPQEIERCHEIGCNSYITKPIDYENFVNTIRQLGLYLTIVQVPTLNGN